MQASADILVFVHPNGELIEPVCADGAHCKDVVDWSEAFGREVALLW